MGALKARLPFTAPVCSQFLGSLSTPVALRPSDQWTAAGFIPTTFTTLACWKAGILTNWATSPTSFWLPTVPCVSIRHAIVHKRLLPFNNILCSKFAYIHRWKYTNQLLNFFDLSKKVFSVTSQTLHDTTFKIIISLWSVYCIGQGQIILRSVGFCNIVVGEQRK